MRSLQIIVALTMLSFAAHAGALPVTINDNYIGGTASQAQYAGLDRIGDVNQFEVEKIMVDVIGTDLVVTVHSNYFDNVGRLGTEMGDLFISSNGWTGFGSAPYVNDTALNGEQWEFALVLDNHGEAYSGSADAPGANMVGAAGEARLYAITAPSQIELSSAAPGYGYRMNQEVQFNPNGAQSLALGLWSITETGDFDTLRMTISLASFGSSGVLGFSWGMTCGNDMVKGSAAVPEPASSAIFGLALLGAMFVRRRAA